MEKRWLNWSVKNENIVVLDADLSGSTKSGMAKKVAPDRHCNMGIAEGNMMAVARGISFLRQHGICQQLCDVCGRPCV